MNGETIQPDLLEGRWDRRKWWGCGVCLFLGHLVLLLVLSERPHLATAPTRAETRFKLTPAFNSGRNTELSWQSDPWVGTLASPHGFSGGAWLRMPVREYKPPLWTDQAPWLAAEEGQLVDELSLAAKSGDLVIRRLTSVGPAPKGDPEARSLLPTGKSSLVLDSSLQRRLSGPLPPIPEIPGAGVLTNSVVRLVVTAGGEVFSRVLISGSGVAAADQKALDLCERLQFSASSPNASGASLATLPLAFGQATFRWAATPATNAPSTNAKP